MKNKDANNIQEQNKPERWPIEFVILMISLLVGGFALILKMVGLS